MVCIADLVSHFRNSDFSISFRTQLNFVNSIQLARQDHHASGCLLAGRRGLHAGETSSEQPVQHHKAVSVLCGALRQRDLTFPCSNHLVHRQKLPVGCAFYRVHGLAGQLVNLHQVQEDRPSSTRAALGAKGRPIRTRCCDGCCGAEFGHERGRRLSQSRLA